MLADIQHEEVIRQGEWSNCWHWIKFAEITSVVLLFMGPVWTVLCLTITLICPRRGEYA